MRRLSAFLFLLALLAALGRPLYAAAASLPFELSSRAAILMEATTGKILLAKDEHVALPPASVTKLMAMLLVMEAVDGGRIKLSDVVTASPEACRMGGSQIWLEEGEKMTVADLMKAVSIVSANDATVALAEHLAGSEEEFVRLMNKRAQELGMKNTIYVNATGLTPDDPAKGKNLTSAYDQAILAREILRHPKVLAWTATWIDYLRGGQSFLRNTNNLVRFYEGCDGLKTGFTEEAGFCLVATAKRAGVRLIAVVMNAPTAAARSAEITKLFNYGFARLRAHVLYKAGEVVGKLPVVLGERPEVPVVTAQELSVVVERDATALPQKRLVLPEKVKSPVAKGAVLGRAVALLDGREYAHVDLVAGCAVPRSGFFRTFFKILGGAFRVLFKRI